MRFTEFCSEVHEWCLNCFGKDISYDPVLRNAAFLEEACELVQSLGMTREEAQFVLNEVYSREDVGEPKQEVGGVMTTLAALCTANDLSLVRCSVNELNRIKEKIPEIREKNQRKKRFKESS